MRFETWPADRAYVTGKYRGDCCPPGTGLPVAELAAGVEHLAAAAAGRPRAVVKAEIFRYLAEHMPIDVNAHDHFVTFGIWDRRRRPAAAAIRRWQRELVGTELRNHDLMERLNRLGIAAMWMDFDHSVPNWDDILALGLPGLRERARTVRAARLAAGGLTAAEAAYFDAVEIEYTAALALLERFRRFALDHPAANGRPAAVAAALECLAHGAPETLYQALTLMNFYFMCCEHIDHMQVRSLGNFDRLLEPFFRRDLAAGRHSEVELREFVSYFLMQWASIDNYWGQPVYLGGTRADGSTEINAFSYLVLEEFDRLAVPTPKFQIKYSAATPRRFVDLALGMIRRGHNSIVFVAEPGIARAMGALGYPAETIRTCDIRGCYEFGPREPSGNTTIVGYLNLLKPLELVFHNGRDPVSGEVGGPATGAEERLATFDDFFAAYRRQLDAMVEAVVAVADDFERHLDRVNPAPLYSGTIRHSLETARDAFAGGCVYNNSQILQTGLGTAVDALCAVRALVYERRELTAAGLRDILAADWRGHEELRLRMLRFPVKYGNGVAAADSLAGAIGRHLAERINRRPNARGGIYELSGHCAKQYWELGKRTGATPDGRHAGDEMSKNLSPTMGMDTCGVTALLRSAASLDCADFPGDFPVDVMLHPATVAGADGLAAMRGLLEYYAAHCGIAIHFNVFDAAALVDAQRHPEKYASLQVRVCG